MTQWLTMSAPTPRTVPSRAASSTLVPTPSVEATSTGSSIAASALAENAPPKLPTPRTTSGPCVRSTAVRIWATARVPSSMSTPAAAYDVSAAPGARQPMSRRTCIPSKWMPPIASYAAARAAARSAPSPVTARTRPPAVCPSTSPAGNSSALDTSSRPETGRPVTGVPG